ncbi:MULTISPECIES: hypothetical protein [Halorussus]|uniref:hypothetical protein n=1 Tax=Halorussus TaxID=1070314 RepID=UPI00209E5C43|nr:hypothetical protein [Halorussus vallis]USZ78708.1 hypothetical protein NGM07_24670 [Halorussus vallis]
MRDSLQTEGQQAPELPKLEVGIRLLDVEGDDRATGPLHSLVLDHLLLNSGSAVWVDAGGHAVTQSLSSVAPSMRTLDRIQVARAFTSHQHYQLIREVAEEIDEDTSLLVCPAFDQFYREAETYTDEGDDLLLRALATVARLADKYEIPILMTREKDDSFSGPIAAAAEETIRCEQTKFGPRFVGDDFETLVYPMENGMVQTTLAFWKHVLEARVRATETTATPQGVSVDGAY